jgi:5-methyltetrahydrofolate--homocysteine methyltransferase
MMNKIQEKLKRKGTLFVDGAWGTMMQNAGLKPGECPELWNLEHPEKVYEIAKSYAVLGVDMVETNSFGGTRFKLANFGLEDKVFEINKAAAELTKKALNEDQIVLGSMGPTGKILMMGDVTEDELYEGFAEQARGLVAGGADAVIVETMTALDEALIAVKAVRENTDLEIIVSFTFELTGAGEFRTMMGNRPAEAISAVIAEGVSIVGTNCGNGLERMIPIIEEIRAEFKDIPVLVNANAGMPHLHEGKTVFPESPDEMAGFIPKIMDVGANIIGGCCGTTPGHIVKMMNAAVRE